MWVCRNKNETMKIFCSFVRKKQRLASPFYLEMHVQESCGCFPSCPFSQVSIRQDPFEWNDPTVSSHWVSCFSWKVYPCCVLCHYFGGKQRSHPLNLTGNRRRTEDISVLGPVPFGNFVGLREMTYSSCYPLFLTQGRGCTDRTRLCFCVSSSTLIPPDLCSVCGSLSHSLGDMRNQSVTWMSFKGCSVHCLKGIVISSSY